MPKQSRPECAFHIPLHRDAEISDGRPHGSQAWRWLRYELYDRFDGLTIAPGLYEGMWKSPLTGQPIHDKTRRFIIALPAKRVDELRRLLKEACRHFDQQCIYFSVGGDVEFVEGPP